MKKRFCVHGLLSGLVVLSALSLIMGRKAEAALGPERHYPVNGSINALATGDFNGDGHPDLAFTADNTGDVTVLLNKGDGSFAPPVHYATGSGRSHSITVGDFNGDGHPDLALIKNNGAKSAITILMNKGNGTFTRGVTYQGDYSATALVVGDFNGDGHPDLALAGNNHYKGEVLILPNKGNGTFGPSVSSMFKCAPNSLAVGDFGKDGHLDLVTICEGADTVSTVVVLTNNGNNTFSPQLGYAAVTNPGPNSVTVGDFNGDGYPDIAVIGNGVIILQNNGDGTFAPGVSYATDGGVIAITSTDFNGDGHPDLVLIESDRNGYIVVMLNKGDGTFVKGPSYGAAGTRAFVIADFNGDGHVDLAMTNHTGVTVLLLVPDPDLAISNTNQGGHDFTVGQKVLYKVTVSDDVKSGPVKSRQEILVTDMLPAGLQNVVVQGKDWQITLQGTISTTTSPLVLKALYIGAYPITPGQLLSPIAISGVLTKDAVASLSIKASVYTEKDSNRKNNVSVDTIHVKAVA